MSSAKQKFESMVKALSGDLYRYAFSLCRNPTLSDDLVAETFMRAWRNLGSLRDDRKAKSWLITTLRREHARLYERYQPPFDDLDLDIAITGTDDVEQNIEVMVTRRAVMGLAQKYREVLMLQVVGGYTGAEIAELVGLPLATVNTRLFRARQQLRKILEPAVKVESGSRAT